MMSKLPGGRGHFASSARVPKKYYLPRSQLQKRVLDVYRRAKKAQDRYPFIDDWGGPSKYFMTQSLASGKMGLNELNPSVLYPHSSFISARQLPEYFLVQHNLELVHWMPKLDELRIFVEKNIGFFQEHQIKVDHPAQEDMRWLARQITPQTQHFLIGEIHDNAIGQTLIPFLRELRRTQRDRRIFLFTEFLPERQIWGRWNPELLYFPDQKNIWDEATLLNISVVGLEPKFVYTVRQRFLERNADEQGRSTPGEEIWSSIAGVRMRNRQWMDVLKEYREQYPDALFLVYAGNAHVDYTEPYSLGRKLAAVGDTQVALLFPEQYQSKSSGETTTWTSRFDEWTYGKLLDRVLQFDSPEVAHKAGFDIRIRVAGLISEEYIVQ